MWFFVKLGLPMAAAIMLRGQDRSLALHFCGLSECEETGGKPRARPILLLATWPAL